VGPIIALNLGLRPSAINPTDFLFQLKLKEKNSGTAQDKELKNIET